MKKTITLILFNLISTLALLAQFSPEQIIDNNANGARAVYCIDLDGDNDNDILLASENDNKITWYENLGANSFSAENLISDGIIAPVSVFAIDFDGDNDNDVISANSGDNTVTLFENLGGGVFNNQNIISNNSMGSSSVYAVDIDSDSDFDIVATSFTDGKVAWYENLGNGAFGVKQVLSQFNGNPRQVFATDIDGDNDPDLLVADALNDVTWFENLGNGAFGGEQIIGSLFYLDDVYADDLDNDGDADIVAAGNYNWIAYYENLGNGQFGNEQIVTDSAGGAVNIYLFDLNGDNLLDILSAERSLDRLVWYENLGASTFSTPNYIATYPGIDNIRDVYASDLNGDGDLDIVASLFTEGELIWFENTGINTFAESILPLEHVKLYPNPSNNQFILEFDTNHTEIVNIAVMNNEGRTIDARIDTDEEKLIIDLGVEPAGIYYLSIISTDNRSVVKKIFLSK